MLKKTILTVAAAGAIVGGGASMASAADTSTELPTQAAATAEDETCMDLLGVPVPLSDPLTTAKLTACQDAEDAGAGQQQGGDTAEQGGSEAGAEQGGSEQGGGAGDIDLDGVGNGGSGGNGGNGGDAPFPGK